MEKKTKYGTIELDNRIFKKILNDIGCIFILNFVCSPITWKNVVLAFYVCRGKEKAPDYFRESILVMDANTGQNGLQQAKIFKEAVNLTSVALTKLDGSAKGGIIISIAKDFKLPVKLIGIGEKIDDLELFDLEKYLYGLCVR